MKDEHRVQTMNKLNSDAKWSPIDWDAVAAERSIVRFPTEPTELELLRRRVFILEGVVRQLQEAINEDGNDGL